MESNSVCKHTRDKQSRTTAKGSPICLITSRITVRIVSCYQLIITVTICEKMNAFFCSKREFDYQMSKIRKNITGRDTV